MEGNSALNTLRSLQTGTKELSGLVAMNRDNQHVNRIEKAISVAIFAADCFGYFLYC